MMQLTKLATETEKTANQFEEVYAELVSRNKIHRFNVYHGLGDIGLQEHKERPQIAGRTRDYLSTAAVGIKLKACIAACVNPSILQAAEGK